MRILKSKKSQEASTITWVFATFLIFIILVLYVSATSWIFLGSDKIKSETQHLGISKSSLTINLIEFMNMPVEKYGTVYDLVASSQIKDGLEDERQTLFSKLAEEYLAGLYPHDYSSIELFADGKINAINGFSAYYNDGSLKSYIAGGDITVSVPIIPNKRLDLRVKLKEK